MWRLQNGQDAISGRYPYMVKLLQGFQNEQFCGGVLIDENTVLTAAHCVHHQMEGTYQYPNLEIGSTRTFNDQDSEILESCATIIHKRFNPVRYQDGYDIAIIKLAGSSTKTPVQLWEGPYDFDLYYRTMGFGLTETGEKAITLQELDIFMTDHEFCEEEYKDQCGRRPDQETCDFLDSVICAETDNADACRGDSGGPLIYVEDNIETGCGKDDKLLGLVSFGLGCGSEDAFTAPGVYTAVRDFADWIKSGGEDGPDSVNSIEYINPDANEELCSYIFDPPPPPPPKRTTRTRPRK
ncbi:hypothetical protein BSKO_12277 [Bryopsis sp. KO-2023]|nr:hypothetical protein BSKO_12277 [Bryopsis sp. KO-2023]